MPLKSLSKSAKLILVLFGILVAFGFFINRFVIHKVEEVISDQLPQEVKLSYEKITINSLSRTLVIEAPVITFLDSTGKIIKGSVSSKSFTFENFAIIDYLTTKDIKLNTVKILSPNGYIKEGFTFNDSVIIDKKESVSSTNKFRVEHLRIENAFVKVYDDSKDSLKIDVTNLNIEVDGLQLQTKRENPNISYEDYSISSDALFLKLDAYNNLYIDEIKGTSEITEILNVHLKTIYDPLDLKNHITIEKDHYDLTIDTIAVAQIPRELKQNSEPFKVGYISVLNPKLKVYRDKLVADDLSIKPMFSEIIRNVPIAFQIDSLQINNGYVNYKERVHPYNEGGEIYFDKSTISIHNLSNREQGKPVKVYVQSYFYSKSPLTATWSFSPTNLDDEFNFSAEIDDIDLSDVNQFSKPNLNATMDGKIVKLFYTISGTKSHSTIDLKANYSNIKIGILDKSHRNRNKFYSSLANLIVSHSSKNKRSDFKEAKVSVKRDMTTSNINFIYVNVKNGLTKVFL